MRMHDAHHGRVPSLPERRRPHLPRRIMSVASGLVSLGLIRVMWAVHRDDYLEWPVTMFIGLLVVAFGAGAAVLWYPKDQAALLRKILLGAVALVIVATGAFYFFAAGN